MKFFNNILFVIVLMFIGGLFFIQVADASHCVPVDREVEYCITKDGRKVTIPEDVKKCNSEGGTPGHDCLYGTGEVPTSFGNPITDPRSNIRLAINVTLGFLGVVVVAMIIYGGVFWITAAGSEERVKKGKQTLMWSAIGAIVISIAWTIASYILQVGKIVGG